jgi:hypothetical protein
MPISFHLEDRIAGFCGNTAKKGESVDVIFRELLGPVDPDLPARLNELQSCLFSKISGFPNPPKISHLAIIINRDLVGEAHIDDFKVTAAVKATRPITAGEPAYVKDIADIESVDFGIKIPNDCAVVVVQSFGWKRSLFYDFGPLLEEVRQRDYPIEKALAQQQLLLLGLSVAQPMFGAGEKRLEKMRAAVAQLEKLLIAKCEAESEYQELLAQNPWMIGALYSRFLRHTNMDDRNIPDFTALRAYDQCHDIVELKQPFLSLFREDGNFSADFNDSWNQAERYLDFCLRQRAYLNDEKGLRFENPRCLLLIGNNPSNVEMKSLRRKQDMNRLVTILTYDQLLAQARHVFELVVAAGGTVSPI